MAVTADLRAMTGRQKAAALMLALGEEHCTKLFALMDEEEMMSLGHVEGQLRAAAIRRVADVAERHPEYVLSLVRGWMTSED